MKINSVKSISASIFCAFLSICIGSKLPAHALEIKGITLKNTSFSTKSDLSEYYFGETIQYSFTGDFSIAYDKFGIPQDNELKLTYTFFTGFARGSSSSPSSAKLFRASSRGKRKTIDLTGSRRNERISLEGDFNARIKFLRGNGSAKQYYFPFAFVRATIAGNDSNGFRITDSSESDRKRASITAISLEEGTRDSSDPPLIEEQIPTNIFIGSIPPHISFQEDFFILPDNPGLTVGMKPVPEPLTILGSIAAVGMGIGMKRHRGYNVTVDEREKK